MSLLLIVARDRPDCYRRLRSAFADDAHLKLVIDRRARPPHPPAPSRVPATMERRRYDVGDRLQRAGWALIEVVTTGPPASLPPEPAGPQKGRILLIEDDQVVLDMLLDTLRFAGYTPMGTVDAREALALLATETFDLVVTDVVMPWVDGLHVLEKTRERNPGAAILMISAFGTDQVVRDSFARGAAGFLAKPFELAAFIAAVRAILTARAR